VLVVRSTYHILFNREMKDPLWKVGAIKDVLVRQGDEALHEGHPLRREETGRRLKCLSDA